MTTELIKFNGEEHHIEVKPVTLIFNRTYGESEYPERTMITPEMTLEHFKSLNEINPYVACLFKLVFPDYNFRITKEQLEKSCIGCRHVVGLFSLTLNMMAAGKKIGWKYPESGLHPQQQLNLADVLAMIANGPELFTKFIRNVQHGYYDEYILGLEDGKNLHNLVFGK